MSATARLLGWCVALWTTLSVSSVLAGPNVLVGGTHVGWLALGQADQSDSATSRREADQWLKQARESMKKGDLDYAGECLDRAEQLGGRQGSIFNPLKDTPAKARQDLEELRRAAASPKSDSAGPIAKLFHKDGGGNGAQPPADPYGGQMSPLPVGKNPETRPGLAGTAPARLPTAPFTQ